MAISRSPRMARSPVRGLPAAAVVNLEPRSNHVIGLHRSARRADSNAGQKPQGVRQHGLVPPRNSDFAKVTHMVTAACRLESNLCPRKPRVSLCLVRGRTRRGGKRCHADSAVSAAYNSRVWHAREGEMMRTQVVQGRSSGLLRSVPFRPFSLNMENGDHIVIEHPENIAF